MPKLGRFSYRFVSKNINQARIFWRKRILFTYHILRNKEQVERLRAVVRNASFFLLRLWEYFPKGSNNFKREERRSQHV
jgi:hypothetical protein